MNKVYILYRIDLGADCSDVSIVDRIFASKSSAEDCLKIKSIEQPYREWCIVEQEVLS